MNSKLQWLAARLILVGGLIQALVALGILFLPVWPTYTTNNFDAVIVGGISYVDLGGDVLGYLTLGLMIGVGIITVFISRKAPTPWVLLLTWLCVLLSICTVAVESINFGKLFIPGTVVLFVAAGVSRPSNLPLTPKSVESHGPR